MGAYPMRIARLFRGPLPTAIALAAGIVVGGSALLGVIAGAAGIYRRYLVVFAFGVGTLLGARDSVPIVRVDDRGVDTVVGVVRGPVLQAGRSWGAELEVAHSSIWLWASEPLVPGQRLEVTGTARSPRGSIGPGQAPRRDRSELTARSLRVIADAPGLMDRAWRWASSTQRAWAARITEAGGDPAARAALTGIVVGDRGAVPDALDERWRAVGIFHVLSVSGLHLAVIAGLAFSLLRRLAAASPWGGRIRPARWAAPPALVLAVIYTLVTGAQLATLRALIVIALLLVAAMLDRPLRMLDALGIAALAILLIRPSDIIDPSFQLSFTAALVLALVRAPTLVRGWRGWIVRGIVTSFWVTLATAPLTAYHFHQVTPSGVVGNLVLTPLLELIALPLALVGIALGSVGAPLVRIAVELVGVVDRAAELGAHAAIVGRIAVASPLALCVLVTTSLVLVALRQRAVGWLVLCVAWSLARTPAPLGVLRVTFLDIGQGDAALVELPDGGVWLVDAGGNASAPALAVASRTGEVIDRALAAMERTRIDLAIISHPHPDHFLGLVGMRAPISELWSARETEAEPATHARAFPAIAARLEQRGTRWVQPPLGSAEQRAGVELYVWGPRYQPLPDAPVVAATDPVRSVNDNSLVVELRYAGRSILFTGDLELEGELQLVAAGLGPVDVVKVPHHGSPTSSSEALIDAASASVAVISCGRGNAFGFPSRAVVERWRTAGATVARTDQGAVTITVDSAGGLAVGP